MGKIVKYCNACEEGFAEKFGFCPNCGAQLTAFEMNPLVADAGPDAVQTAEEIPVPEIIADSQPVETVASFAPIEAVAETSVPETIEIAAVESERTETIEPVTSAGEFEFDDEVLADSLVDEQTAEKSDVAPTVAGFGVPASSKDIYDATYRSHAAAAAAVAEADAFHITIVEEKNVKQRNMLLLGVFVLFFGAFLFGLVYSLFNQYLDVAAIDTPDLISYVGEVVPVPFEEEILKKDKEKGGGGGGGGKEEESPASKGREAAQVPDPIFSPSSKSVPLTNPDIEILLATKNKNPRSAENTDEPYGLRNGADRVSDGTGTGGGLGNGRGRGQGNGNGDGLGNGNGDGRGNGNGNGEGNGNGGGGDEFGDLKPKVGPTVGVKIISKPRPGYTDSARVNNIQGTVILKVTFLANGQVGGVSVVKGLPNGLTEQAIAAAKGIRFEPAKRAGSPYAVNKNVEYSFTIF